LRKVGQFVADGIDAFCFHDGRLLCKARILPTAPESLGLFECFGFIDSGNTGLALCKCAAPACCAIKVLAG
jgi:hypothetical protein